MSEEDRPGLETAVLDRRHDRFGLEARIHDEAVDRSRPEHHVGVLAEGQRFDAGRMQPARQGEEVGLGHRGPGG